MAQLSIIVRGLRAEGWLSVAGDVSYGPSSAIGMCAGGWWRFWGQKTSFLFALQDDVSEHAEGSVLAERSAMSRRKTTLAFGSACRATSSDVIDQDEGC